MYEWLLDNSLTPQILVDADEDGVQVPREHVSDGQIVLNISPSAVRDLSLGNDFVEFSARFGGVPRQILVPTAAVRAVLAREVGAVMSFAGLDPEPDEPPPDPGPGDPPAPGDGGRPKLRVVK